MIVLRIRRVALLSSLILPRARSLQPAFILILLQELEGKVPEDGKHLTEISGKGQPGHNSSPQSKRVVTEP